MRTRTVTHAGIFSFLRPASRYKLMLHAVRVAALQHALTDEINSYRLYCPLFTLHERAKADFLWSHSHRPSPIKQPSSTTCSTYYLVANYLLFIRTKLNLPIFYHLLINNIESPVRLLFLKFNVFVNSVNS